MDFYMVSKQQFLSCIDVYSKFATLVEVTGRDWLKAKRALMEVFNEMGKPQEIKADKDLANICVALHNWLNSDGVQIEITTSKNGISDIEMFHKTVNGNLRIL